MNDLPICGDCKTVMYADDTTLLFRSSDQVSLQIDLDSNLNRIAQSFNSLIERVVVLRGIEWVHGLLLFPLF